MAQFKRQVLAVQLRQDHRIRASAGRHYRRLNQWLTQSQEQWDEARHEWMRDFFNKHPELHTLYHLKEELDQLWTLRTRSKEELVEAFKAWCEKAESAGVQTLSEFSAMLKQYSLQPVPVRR